MSKARDLANIISGGFTADDIPNLDASKITSGNIATGRLGNVDLTNLSASSLTSGTVPSARLDSVATQTAGNNSTKIANTEFVSTAVSNLVDSSPDALNTLNELASALGDDANFSTTVTNSLATKLTSSSSLDASNLTGTASAINGSNITNLTAGNLVGALPAISGANLTGLSGGLSHISFISGSYGASTASNQSENEVSNGIGNAPSDAKGGIVIITGTMGNYTRYVMIKSMGGASMPSHQSFSSGGGGQFIDVRPFTCSGGSSLTLRTAHKKYYNASNATANDRKYYVLFVG
tara:strand:+ start:20 stop:901 length:882 start_codon:yes stop_codon:yes gene_type:complete